MSEEEKEAIEKIKNFMNNEEILQYQIKEKDIDTILNYISKLEDERDKYYELYSFYSDKYNVLESKIKELKRLNE